jgi:hypothetical protein
MIILPEKEFAQRGREMKKLIIFVSIIIILSACAKKSANERENITETAETAKITAYNINNALEIEIPEEMEVVAIKQYLAVNYDNTRYCIDTSFRFIYENRYLSLVVQCYGSADKSILDGTKILNMEKYSFYGEYNIASQIKELKQNYTDNLLTNKNGVEFSRLVSYWPSGATSDYYGLYFKLPGKDFSECIISINNIWGSFDDPEKLSMPDNDYKEKVKSAGGKLEAFFNLLDEFENSISFKTSGKAIKAADGFAYEKYNIDDMYVVPATDNLRMRKEPSLTGEVSGYMKDVVYKVIKIGDEAEIDGIKGNWLMVKEYFLSGRDDNALSWVFSAYTRPASEEELYVDEGI